MLIYPGHILRLPKTVGEALRMYADDPHGSLYRAGGTDIGPNMKQGLHKPRQVVALRQLDELRGIQVNEHGDLVVGALTTLHEIMSHPDARKYAPGLIMAIEKIAGPTHRRMGTIGGNILLDTRCRWYNQTQFWRDARGGCLKAEGDLCHVTGKSIGCVAARASDAVPMLMALGAWVRYRKLEGEDYHQGVNETMTHNGLFGPHARLPKGALLMHVVIPKAASGTRCAFKKVRVRESIDFPLLNVAVRGTFDGDRLVDLEGYVGGGAPMPKGVRIPGDVLGEVFNQDAVEAIVGRNQRFPILENVLGSAAWRRDIAPVYVRRALEDLLP